MQLPFSFIVATSENTGRNIAVSLRCDNVVLESEYFEGVPEAPGARAHAVESRCRPLHQETTFIIVVDDPSILQSREGLSTLIRHKLFGEMTTFLARAAAVQCWGNDEEYILLRNQRGSHGPHNIRDDLPAGVKPPPGREYIP